MNDQTLGMAKTGTVTYNNITAYTKKYQCFIINVSISEKSIVFNTIWQAITQLVLPAILSTSWGCVKCYNPKIWGGGGFRQVWKTVLPKSHSPSNFYIYATSIKSFLWYTLQGMRSHQNNLGVCQIL